MKHPQVFDDPDRCVDMNNEANCLMADLPEEPDGDLQFAWVRDTPCNALICIGADGRLSIWPKEGGWIGVRDAFHNNTIIGDLGPFAG